MAAFVEPSFTCYTAQKVVVFDEDREEVLKEQRSKLEGYLKGHEEAGENVILSGGCIGASAGLLGHGCGFVAAFIGYFSFHPPYEALKHLYSYCSHN